MLENARRASPALPGRIVWLALGLIALAGIVVAVVVLVSTPSASGSGGRVGARAAAPLTHASCARSDRKPASSARSGVGAALVPPGARSVLLCRYGLLHRGGLTDRRLIVSRALTAQLAGALNALPRRRVIVCPMFDTGQVLIAHFRYASGPEDAVTIDLSGCESVSNGHVSRLGLGGSAIDTMLRLVPKSGFGGRLAG